MRNPTSACHCARLRAPRRTKVMRGAEPGALGFRGGNLAERLRAKTRGRRASPSPSVKTPSSSTVHWPRTAAPGARDWPWGDWPCLPLLSFRPSRCYRRLAPCRSAASLRGALLPAAAACGSRTPMLLPAIARSMDGGVGGRRGAASPPGLQQQRSGSVAPSRGQSKWWVGKRERGGLAALASSALRSSSGSVPIGSITCAAPLPSAPPPRTAARD